MNKKSLTREEIFPFMDQAVIPLAIKKFERKGGVPNRTNWQRYLEYYRSEHYAVHKKPFCIYVNREGNCELDASVLTEKEKIKFNLI